MGRLSPGMSKVLISRASLRNSARPDPMFVVYPFRKDPDIRSVLGFMSLSTRWGDYLFPGITVLTRDLYAVQAMHQVAVRMKAWEPAHRAEFQRQSTDSKIARQLSRNLPPDRRDDDVRLQQQMTYWQRYGSLFSHFGLLQDRRKRSVRWYQRLIFDPSLPRVGEDSAALRHRRVTHFRWYRRNRSRLIDPPLEDRGRRLFRGASGSWRRWWLTGHGAPPAHVPEPIRLVRQLEFFFTVWQTLFEAAVRTISMGGRLALRPPAPRDPVAEFASLLLEAGRADQEGTSRQLVGVCMKIHERLIAPRLVRWQRDVARLFGPAVALDPFIRLHDGRTLAEFGSLDGVDLLDALATLHVTYCEIQGKPYAACVSRFRPTPAIMRRPGISAVITPRRYGLFGYRLEAAARLFSTGEGAR
jgi:hypothetical protein